MFNLFANNPDASRRYTPLDCILMEVNHALKVCLTHNASASSRPYPADTTETDSLSEQQRKLSAGLMRVNHAGEIAAQALYKGQAITCNATAQQQRLRQAAQEEIDHLAWCEQRLSELSSHPSKLALFWYAASFAIGSLAGLAGDRWSLGFIEETERQVADHLDRHLHRIPAADKKSRAIILQMRADETEHANWAHAAGALPLPAPIKHLMQQTAKLMTVTSFHL